MATKRSNDERTTTESPSKKPKGNAKEGGPDRGTVLLGRMLEYHMEGNKCISYEKLRVDIGIGHRVKSWVKAWKTLREDEYIEPSSKGEKGFQMTQKGLDHAATDEYKEHVKESSFVPKTNEEKHERIKKRLKWQRFGCEVFDLLLQHGPLTSVELAAIVGVKRGTHRFSYAVKELKDKSLVEVDPGANKGRNYKKLRLSDAAFLNSEDRPIPSELDPVDIALKLEDNAKRKRGIQKAAKGEITMAEAAKIKDKKDEDELGKLEAKKISESPDHTEDSDSINVDKSEDPDGATSSSVTMKEE